MSSTKDYEPLTDFGGVLEILNEISIFAGLEEGGLQQIFATLGQAKFAAGDIIFREGTSPSHIYIVRSGRVRIVAGLDTTPLELVEFGTGQCFGETSVIGILPHSASALAVAPTELIVFPRLALMAFFETDPRLFSVLVLNIAREACRRLHKTDKVLLHYVKH